ncbi:hypothetical protein F2P81_005540 [Scophthalmus maximus]|uniref:Uncharacterized protein n=1 Tax=Scophthalmus maximus TaxID=52904 RepID=A0A6A4TC82_SCOMX|nr:hypothetical protein F2P81_005540 [Scophthalmus maximus]
MYLVRKPRNRRLAVEHLFLHFLHHLNCMYTRSTLLSTFQNVDSAEMRSQSCEASFNHSALQFSLCHFESHFGFDPVTGIENKPPFFKPKAKNRTQNIIK